MITMVLGRPNACVCHGSLVLLAQGFDYWSQCGWSTVSPFEVGLPSQDWCCGHPLVWLLKKQQLSFQYPLIFFQVSTIFSGIKLDQTDPSLGTCPTWSSTDSKSAVFSITSRAFCGFAQQLRQMSTKIECMTSGVLQRWHIHYQLSPLSLCDFYVQTTCSVACQKLLSSGHAPQRIVSTLRLNTRWDSWTNCRSNTQIDPMKIKDRCIWSTEAKIYENASLCPFYAPVHACFSRAIHISLYNLE